jgi:hypothetical protein
MWVSAELPWLENDDWLEAGKPWQVPPAEPGRTDPARIAPTGYAHLAVLAVLLTELAWFGFLLSLGYRFVS